jgi:hypothetical protein
MADLTWIGGATSVAQIDSFAITNAGGSTETWTMTITAEDRTTDTGVTYVSDGSPTTAEEVVGLVAAWNADPYASSIATASGTDTPLVLTAYNAGVPIRVTLAASGTGAVTKTTTRVNEGPNAYATPQNWSTGNIPVANDNVLLQGSNDILYDLYQSAIELDDFIVDNYSGAIGSASAPLQIDMGNSDTFKFGGTGLAWIDVTSAAISPIIMDTATVSSGAGLHLKGSAIATIDFRKGSMALFGTSTVTTIIQSYISSPSTDAILTIPIGTTLTTLNKTGGEATLNVAATTITNTAGILWTYGSGAITTVNVHGGSVYPCSSGTITTLNLRGGTTDFNTCGTARTVTTVNQYGGSTLAVDDSVVTLTNKVAPGERLNIVATAA